MDGVVLILFQASLKKQIQTSHNFPSAPYLQEVKEERKFPVTGAQRGPVTLMRVMPSASLGTLPVISSQIRWMNWWGMTNTSRSASCTASLRFATATCEGEGDTVTPSQKHISPRADQASDASAVQTDSQIRALFVLPSPLGTCRRASEASRVLPLLLTSWGSALPSPHLSPLPCKRRP